jgi:muconolactone D-isomerase
MLFMLRIESRLPPDMPQGQRESLLSREHARSTELIDDGVLLRIWRIVGRIANFSVWQAESLERLHETLSTLPLFPYMTIEVTPLIDHPMTAATEHANGPTGRRA